MPKKKRHTIGTVVRSRFRAPWYGVVVDHDLGPGSLVVAVRRTHDRRGNPMRKVDLRTYSSHWLVPVPREDRIVQEALHRAQEYL